MNQRIPTDKLSHTIKNTISKKKHGKDLQKSGLHTHIFVFEQNCDFLSNICLRNVFNMIFFYFSWHFVSELKDSWIKCNHCKISKQTNMIECETCGEWYDWYYKLIPTLFNIQKNIFLFRSAFLFTGAVQE